MDSIKYILMVLCLLCVGLCAEVVSGTEKAAGEVEQVTVTVDDRVKDGVPEGIVTLFDKLDKAVIAGKPSEVGKLFDYDKLVELSAYESMPEEMKVMLKIKLPYTMPENILMGFLPVSAKIMHVKREDGNYIVMVRHFERNGISSLARWWVVQSEDQFLFYDVEFFDLPIRLSMNIQLSLAQASSVVSEDQKSVMRNISGAINALSDQDYWSAEDYLGQVGDVKLPGHYDMLRNVLVLMYAVGVEDVETGSKMIKKLEKDYPDMPYLKLCRILISLQKEDFNKALEYCVEYKKLTGDIADVLVLEGEAYEGLEEPEKAFKCYSDGLADMPGSLECLAGYIRLFEGDKTIELEKRFTETPYLAENFYDFWGLLTYGEHYEIASIALEVYKKLCPDQDCNMYEAELAYLQGDYKKIIEALEGKRSSYVDDEDKLLMYDQYLFTAYIETLEFEKALAYSLMCYEADGDPFLVMIACAYSGEYAKAAEYLAECKYYGYTLDVLGEIPLFMNMVSNDEIWSNLSVEVDKLSSGSEEEFVSLVLLDRTGLEMDQTRLEGIVSRALGIDFSKEKEGGQFVVGEGEAYIIKLNGGVFMFNNINSPYVFEELGEGLMSRDLSRAAISHRAWVSVDMLQLTNPEDIDYAYQVAGRILGGIINDNCVAVYAPSLGVLKANDVYIRQALVGDDPLKVFR